MTVHRYSMAFSEADADIWAHLEQQNIPKAAYIKSLIRRDIYANQNMGVHIAPVMQVKSAEEVTKTVKPATKLDFGGMEF